jgi:hypothetical protein
LVFFLKASPLREAPYIESSSVSASVCVFVYERKREIKKVKKEREIKK